MASILGVGNLGTNFPTLSQVRVRLSNRLAPVSVHFQEGEGCGPRRQNNATQDFSPSKKTHGSVGHHVTIAERRVGHDDEVSDIDEIGLGELRVADPTNSKVIQPREKLPIAMKWAAIAATTPITTRKRRFPTQVLEGDSVAVWRSPRSLINFVFGGRRGRTAAQSSTGFRSVTGICCQSALTSEVQAPRTNVRLPHHGTRYRHTSRYEIQLSR